MSSSGRGNTYGKFIVHSGYYRSHRIFNIMRKLGDDVVLGEDNIANRF